MSGEAIVAVILALAVLVFVFNGTGLRVLLGADAANNTPEAYSAWENVVSVIIGALAGYMAGKERK